MCEFGAGENGLYFFCDWNNNARILPKGKQAW